MIIIITDGIAHTSERGPGTRSELHKSEFSLPSLLPAGSRGTQAFRPPAAPPRRPSQRPPFMLHAQSGAFTGVPRAGLPPPAAPRSSPLVASPARQAWGPAHDRAAWLRTPAPFFSHGWHTPTTSDWSGPPASDLDWWEHPPQAGPYFVAAGADWPLPCSCGRGSPGGPAPLSPQAEASGRPWKPVSAWGSQPAGGGGAGLGLGRLEPRDLGQEPRRPARAAGEKR